MSGRIMSGRVIVIHDAKGLKSLFKLFIKVYKMGIDFDRISECLFNGLSQKEK